MTSLSSFTFFSRQAWDLAVDICLSQLPTIIEEGTAFRVSWIISQNVVCPVLTHYLKPQFSASLLLVES